MATIYIKDDKKKYHKINIGRQKNAHIVVDWGGCTGDIIEIDMDMLWDGAVCVFHSSCVTQDINGDIIVDDKKLEVLDA